MVKALHCLAAGVGDQSSLQRCAFMCVRVHDCGSMSCDDCELAARVHT